MQLCTDSWQCGHIQGKTGRPQARYGKQPQKPSKRIGFRSKIARAQAQTDIPFSFAFAAEFVINFFDGIQRQVDLAAA